MEACPYLADREAGHVLNGVLTSNVTAPAKLLAAGMILNAPLYVPLLTVTVVALNLSSVNPVLTAYEG